MLVKGGPGIITLILKKCPCWILCQGFSNITSDCLAACCHPIRSHVWFFCNNLWSQSDGFHRLTVKLSIYDVLKLSIEIKTNVHWKPLSTPFELYTLSTVGTFISINSSMKSYAISLWMANVWAFSLCTKHDLRHWEMCTLAVRRYIWIRIL